MAEAVFVLARRALRRRLIAGLAGVMTQDEAAARLAIIELDAPHALPTAGRFIRRRAGVVVLARSDAAAISDLIALVVDEFGSRREVDVVEPMLTRRERDIAELFQSGATYGEVAQALGLTINTVRHHVRNLYQKLDVRSKTEAALRLSRGRSS